jgi:hypothetical protein
MDEGVAVSHHLGEFEIHCDAPPYAIVRACSRVGVQSPEDVRWCRLNRFLTRHLGWRDLLSSGGWKAILGMGKREEGSCTCGQRLPALERCTFQFASGKAAAYLIGQCRGCRTVFWEEP